MVFIFKFPSTMPPGQGALRRARIPFNNLVNMTYKKGVHDNLPSRNVSS